VYEEKGESQLLGFYIGDQMRIGRQIINEAGYKYIDNTGYEQHIIANNLQYNPDWSPKSDIALNVEQEFVNSTQNTYLNYNYQISDKGKVYIKHYFKNDMNSELSLSESQTFKTSIGADYQYDNEGNVYADVSANNYSELTTRLGFNHAVSLNDEWSLGFGLENENRNKDNYKSGNVRVNYKDDERNNASLGYEFSEEEANSTHAVKFKSLNNLQKDNYVFVKNNYYYIQKDNDDEYYYELDINYIHRPIDNDVHNFMLGYEYNSKYEEHKYKTFYNYSVNSQLQSMSHIAYKKRPNYQGFLLNQRVIYDLTNKWDIGGHIGLLHEQEQTTPYVGVETGYQILPKTWLSVGYNTTYLKDNQYFDNENTTLDNEYYVKARFKLDKSVFFWLYN
jgi:hypothetical protein